MSSFPRSPRLLKGALVSVDPANPLASVIIFQYNPETMTRRLEARSTGGRDGARGEAYRLTGPPRETITVAVEVDAADQLERGDPRGVAMGVYPALSALELLLYPRSSTVIQNAALARLGNIEIIPPEAPMTLFVWGAKRVMPVRLSSFSITEEAFDPALNPIRAKVDLSLQVLSYADFETSEPGYHLFLAHQIAKEVMATVQAAAGIESLGTGLKIS